MSAASDNGNAKFLTGPTMKHVINMTVTGSIGLIAVFFVDALNLFYISQLGEQELAAAIGYAGTLLFFTVSVSIGLMIATAALVSRALGQGKREEAAKTGGASLAIMFAISLVLVVLIWPFLDQLVALLGAEGQTAEVAVHFMKIVVPTAPLMALGMGASGILRAVGDAKRAMYVTLIAGAVTAVLDPILIFGLDMGVTGAAITTVIARIVLMGVGLYGAAVVHGLVELPEFETVRKIIRPYFGIGMPAVLTQIATPVGNAYVTAAMAGYGDEAVAGWAIIGRILPVAFGTIFALSGAVGPILGQNYGARLYTRIYSTMRDSLIFTLVYVVMVWLMLALFRHQIAGLFDATGLAYELVVFFCTLVAASFLFNGALFVANAAFNNLGFALYSTLLNWGRSTLGIVPFVWIGGTYWGAHGVLAGWGLGAVVFGVVGVVLCFRTIKSIEGGDEGDDDVVPDAPPTSNSPFSTGKAATIG